MRNTSRRWVYKLGLVLAVTQICGCNGDDDNGKPSSEWGKFSHSPSPKWCEVARNMKLEADLRYTDPRGKVWTAPNGSVIDGASIPQMLWTFVGAPFTGKYRDASVIHDVACRQRSEGWEDVHSMFYEACRARGVGEKRAKIMYWAVRNFGPRWDDGASPLAQPPCDSTRVETSERRMDELMLKRVKTLRRMPSQRDKKDFEDAIKLINEKNPSMEELKGFRSR